MLYLSLTLSYNIRGIGQHNGAEIDNHDEHNQNDSSMNEGNENLSNQFEQTLNDTNMDGTMDDDIEGTFSKL